MREWFRDFFILGYPGFGLSVGFCLRSRVWRWDLG